MVGSVVRVLDMNWNIPAIAKAMDMAEDAVSESLKDGRSAVFFVSRKLADKLPGFKLVRSAQTKHGLVDNKHDTWAVKCLTSHGIDFSKSSTRRRIGSHISKQCLRLANNQFDDIAFRGNLLSPLINSLLRRYGHSLIWGERVDGEETGRMTSKTVYIATIRIQQSTGSSCPTACLRNK